jgi:hypothetical protein
VVHRLSRVILVPLLSNIWSGPLHEGYMKRGIVYLEHGRRSFYSFVDV